MDRFDQNYRVHMSVDLNDPDTWPENKKKKAEYVDGHVKVNEIVSCEYPADDYYPDRILVEFTDGWLIYYDAATSFNKVKNGRLRRFLNWIADKFD